MLLALIGALSGVSSNAWAINEITTVDLRYQIQDNRLVMDSQTHITLPESLMDALHHEITLTFTTEIQLIEHNRLWRWNFERRKKTIRYQTQLYATGFNRRYVLFNSRNKKMQSFATLNNALEAFGTLQNFHVLDVAAVNPERPHTLKMQIALNRSKLPAPLILNTLFEPDWQISSGWSHITLPTLLNPGAQPPNLQTPK